MVRTARYLRTTLIWCLVVFFIRLFLVNSGEEQGENDFLGSDAIWKQVLKARDRFLVYSAYLKNSTQHVRIVGAARLHKLEAAWCLFWYNDMEDNLNETVSLVPAKIQPIRENWGLNYSACFVLCNISNKERIPVSVSIYSEEAVLPFLRSKNKTDLPEPGNKLRIHERGTKNNEPNLNPTLAACVKPLHYNYSKVWELIEWIELNKILGISHFYFYDHEAADNTSCVLNEYSKIGDVTLLDWKNLPFISQKNIRTENMFAALNDCLYRGMYKHAYLTMIDTDEYIVQRRNESLVDFMLTNESENTSLAAAVFKNAFFYLQWPDNPNYKGLNLVTQKKVKRKKDFFPAGRRSKYICKPERVVEVGNHLVAEITDKKFQQLAINVSDGFMHHYRICEAEGDWCIASPNTNDNYMAKYKSELERNVLLVQKKIGNKCNLKPINTIA